MENGPKFEQKLSQISHQDLWGNINALGAMAGEDITDKQWSEIFVSEQVAGNGELLDALHDHLLYHGDEIQTADQLRALVQQLKKQK